MVKFSLHLTGSEIGSKKAPIDVIGKILIEFNRLIYNISTATEKIPKKSKDRKHFFNERKLYFTGYDGGSAELEISTTNQNTLTGEPKIVSLLNTAFEYFDEIRETEEEIAYKKITDRFSNNDIRPKILRNYQNLISQPNVSIEIKSSASIINLPKKIDHTYYQRVGNWLQREYEKTEIEKIGTIKRIKADGKDRYFTFFDETDTPIKCVFKEEQESNIIDLFKIPSKLIGIEARVKTKRFVGEVLEIMRIEKIYLTSQDYLPLLKPIPIEIEYEQDLEAYIGIYEELGIRVIDECIEGLKEEFIIQLDFMVDTYIIQNYQKITQNLRTAVEKLRIIIDPSKRNSESWVFVGEK